MVKFQRSGLGDDKHHLSLIKNLNLYFTKISKKLAPHELALSGQPLDLFYLKHSKIFEFSRKCFLKNGGTFKPSLLSSERSLSSSNLLLNEMEYSPIESELQFRAHEKDKNLRDWVKLCTSTFHEQNHRYLWNTLPVPKILNAVCCRVYLNFIESLVVTLDMMLADSIGVNLSTLGYQLGVIYDPGTDVQFKNEREALNYYHCACHATFLHLEGYNEKNIGTFLEQKHGHLESSLRKRAVTRSLKLDTLFVHFTNPNWQKLHARKIKTFFKSYPKKRQTLNLSLQTGEMLEEYVLVENVLSSFLKQTT